MFTSTFGIPQRPPSAAHTPDIDALSPQQRALLRLLDQAISPDRCHGAGERPCRGCDACQQSFTF